ncbi:MAG: hypothetical protein FJW54_07035 [Actinobacteria bacterium]|nr:hypothetical protein [Actinomycetota bacterium]
MAGKKSGSDNPWAEMSRLKLDSKEVKAPAPDSPRAASIKEQTPQEVVEVVKTTTAAPAVEGKLIQKSPKDEVEEEIMAENEEVVEYSAEQLQEMSLKELRALAKESGVEFKGLSKEELIDALIVEIGITEESEEELVLLEEDEESDEEELEAEEIDGEMSLEEALALLGEDSETEEDFEDVEFEEVEVEVQEGDASFELDDNNSNG